MNTAYTDNITDVIIMQDESQKSSKTLYMIIYFVNPHKYLV